MRSDRADLLSKELPWKHGLQKLLSKVQDHIFNSEDGKYGISRRSLEKLSDEIESDCFKHPAKFMIRFWKVRRP